MTDAQTLTSPPAPKAPSKPSPTKKKRGKASSLWPFAMLVLFVFILSALVSVYFWQQLEKQNALIGMLTKATTAAQARSLQLEKGLNQRFSTLEVGLQTQANVFNQLKQQNQFNTQQLHDLGARSRSDWLMAETEYLMHLANQRLFLEQDVRGAEAILMSADQVLSENNDPGLLMVRQALAEEILALQQTKTVDSNGVFIRLSAMIKSLDHLNAQAFLTQQYKNKQEINTPDNTLLNETIASSSASQGSDQNTWQAISQGILDDLKKVFIIRRLDQIVEPLLAPEQSYYLKQNLKLMLEQASVSLLDKNQVVYQGSLEKASRWLNDYFDLSDSGTQILVNSIGELKQVKITPILPNISNSLRLLKERIEAMYQNHTLGKLSRPSQKDENGSLEGSVK